MDWSAMFSAPVVVFGCGNTLFGDDGAAPAAVSELAREYAGHPGVAFLDAGTSIRTLLADLLLSGATPRRIVLVDAVMEPGREPGSIREAELEPARAPREACGMADTALSLHQAPTPELLEAARTRLGCEVRVLTVQGEHIPETMEQGLSLTVSECLPALKRAILRLCQPLCGKQATNHNGALGGR